MFTFQDTLDHTLYIVPLIYRPMKTKLESQLNTAHFVISSGIYVNQPHDTDSSFLDRFGSNLVQGLSFRC